VIIDSGANVNYANREWCKRANIEMTNTGPREIRAYDGAFIKDEIHEAVIAFKIRKGSTSKSSSYSKKLDPTR